MRYRIDPSFLCLHARGKSKEFCRLVFRTKSSKQSGHPKLEIRSQKYVHHLHAGAVRSFMYGLTVETWTSALLIPEAWTSALQALQRCNTDACSSSTVLVSVKARGSALLERTSGLEKLELHKPACRQATYTSVFPQGLAIMATICSQVS